jgi:glycosyltransferase involved in cell wall biosynthesis
MNDNKSSTTLNQRINSVLSDVGHLLKESPAKTPLKLAYWVSKGTLRQKLHYHRARRIIQSSGLFDADYYARNYSPIIVEPLHDYLTKGAAEGRNPCLLFDTEFYVMQQKDLAGGNALLHYIQAGAAVGRNPHPLFCTAFYLDRNPDVAQAGMNPLQHYVAFGAKEGRVPHPLFDSSFYLERNPDVAESGMDPLRHYLEFGFKEGRTPCRLFDPAFYTTQKSGIGLMHYMKSGAKAGLDPHPLFSSSFYLGHNPDVANAGYNPLEHYVLFGGKERRDPHALFDSALYLQRDPQADSTGMTPLECYLESGASHGISPHWMFDCSFYVERNPEVASTGENPLIHFIRTGARELRDPHPLFDCSFYLSSQPDVRRTGVNPLVHFVEHGAAEGRSPHFLFDFDAYLQLHPDLKDYEAAAKHAAQNSPHEVGQHPQPATPMARFIQDQAAPSNNIPDLKMSVVIPTHNRVDVLEGTLQRCLQVSKYLRVDFIIVSDGCTDNTLDCLQWYSRNYSNISFVALEKSGPGAARNAGAAKAQGDVVMFIGDDIRPVDSEFFLSHLRAHDRLPQLATVVEGQVKWPSQPNYPVTPVMRLIQGAGAQQFGYYYMEPHGFFDWRHFWSANISVKRRLVKEWNQDGFSRAFPAAAYEDVEFAYRASKLHKDFRVYYAAESVGEHFHHYDVADFVKRQNNAGRMARTLVDLHPELASLIHIDQLDYALRSRKPDPKDHDLLPEFEGVVRGLKSWGAIMEAHADLGTQEWHDAYLNALFQLCHDEGYLNTFCAKDANLVEGYRVMVRRFQQQLATSRSAVPILKAVGMS